MQTPMQFTIVDAVQIVIRDGALVAVDVHPGPADEMEIVLGLAGQSTVRICCPLDPPTYDMLCGVREELAEQSRRRAEVPHRVAGAALVDRPGWLVLRPLADTLALSRGELFPGEAP
jgi:hypothetical protein